MFELLKNLFSTKFLTLNSAQAFLEYQPLLIRISTQLLGCKVQAEDVVQETFYNWLKTNTDKVQNTKAFLVKSVTNACYNQLTALKHKKTVFLENWSSEAILEKYQSLDFPNFDLENEVNEAMVTLSNHLEPTEKAVFILREVFDFDYEEIQAIIDKKADNCRKLLQRAKGKLNELSDSIHLEKNIPTCNLSFDFIKACKTGSYDGILSTLKAEIAQKIQKL